eukprot:4107605-Prymnesium_polylepis.2
MLSVRNVARRGPNDTMESACGAKRSPEKYLLSRKRVLHPVGAHRPGARSSSPRVASSGRSGTTKIEGTKRWTRVHSSRASLPLVSSSISLRLPR